MLYLKINLTNASDNIAHNERASMQMRFYP